MWISLVTLATMAALAHGHGRVVDPAGRGSLWRVGYPARANYDDDGLNCGGFYHQHTVNGGKCGVCGDPFDAAQPRPHERGGIYDSGIIAGTYEEGSVIPITVYISAYHKGYWEFKLCPDPVSTDQACFDQYLLELETGGTKFYMYNGSSTYVAKYKLPAGLTCDNCVLQWRYICGNNWGDCKNGTQGLGCGDQENFGACSDITITGRSGNSNTFVPVDSLLLTRLNELGLLRLVYNGSIKPYYWLTSTVAPPRKNSMRRKHKGKKKVKPYKSKWTNYWNQRV